MTRNKAARPPLYIQRLHPANLPFALFFSLFRPVVFWRAERISPAWLSRLKQLDPAELLGLAEWQEVIGSSFKIWQASFDYLSRLPAPQAHFLGRLVSFRVTWMQALAVQLEDRLLFLAMLQRLPKDSRGSYFLAEIDKIIEQAGTHLPDCGVRYSSRIFLLADRCLQAAGAFAGAVRRIAALAHAKANDPIRPARILWTGVSGSEIATSDFQLDFSFLVSRGAIESGECLYLLPQTPEAEKLARLASTNVRWTTPKSLGLLPLRTKLFAAVYLTARAIDALVSALFFPLRLAAAAWAIDALPVVLIARAYRIRTYVTSVSVCWPERPEVEALSAFGIRTINWSYGANTFCYSSDDPSFLDLGVARSQSSSREVWIWNSEVVDWLRARALGASAKFVTTGPVMCGDSRWCALDPVSARRSYGIQERNEGTLYVAVFDVPPLSRSKRLEVGHGPSMYPVEMMDAFFADCQRLLDEFPNIVLVVKPKRAADDPNRDYPLSARRVFGTNPASRSGQRILVLPHNIDPYIAVGISDISIGIPFTSPVLVARASGRLGLFHDPRSEILYFQPKSFSSFTTHGYKELAGALVRSLNTERRYGWETGDPVAQYAKELLRHS